MLKLLDNANEEDFVEVVSGSSRLGSLVAIVNIMESRFYVVHLFELAC